MKAIQVSSFGAPEVLEYRTVPLPIPKDNEVRIKIAVIGVNFVDIYQRTGDYPQDLPFIPGLEASGVVDLVGSGVTSFRVGDRVSCVQHQGTYAEYVVVPVNRLVPIPSGIHFPEATAVLIQGLTAHYLSHTTYPLRKGHLALIHAAAGGVGNILIQLAKRSGAYVIGTTSTEAKAELAFASGADRVILYSEEDFEQKVKEITSNRGVDVVYDSVGFATFEGSLRCLRDRGHMVLYGQSSGAVPPFDPQVLNQLGSLTLTRPSLEHYINNRTELI